MYEAPSRAMSRRGRTLKLYLVDGSPSGVITAELGISSVRAAVASRTALPDLIRREEASRTGLYLLVGPDPDLPGRQRVYVGEGDKVKTRLAAHDADESKEFFTRAVLIVSKDENLTKAHGRYLESRIIAAIRGAGRAKLINGTEPPFKGLPEPEIADMERVLEEIEILLPVLGFDVLRPAGQDGILSARSAGPEVATAPAFISNQAAPIFIFTESGTNARAREAGDEFVVLAGSIAKAQEVPSCEEGLKRRRAQMISEGKLSPAEDPKFLRFLADTAFDTPSGAARVVYGGNVSGPRYWRHEASGQTCGDWRKRRIAEGGEA
ncbi:GIY-YIG nuclease family protein [Phyllobacterium zundukense]|uniref:GIY-YIG nuclease family protein n=1 Tax=Phyllobacterium zundukense TaxID=1867719 RepID=A0ACD4CV85_9HYPH|nr:GIY-YIG nuclease family protein [Phyllobacterium zundukense]UXN57466.1 GIY-YIG nuclease family protein [Phyllobacterium zundukense]